MSANLVRPTTERITIAGPAGDLEALLEIPAGADGARVAVICHPHPVYGGTMTNKVVHVLAKACNDRGVPALRFNFRGVGASEGEWDEGPGELADYRAALDAMASLYPQSELWAAGFSFGSYIALTAGATDDRVRLLLGIALPVNRYDYSAVRTSPKPKFLIQAERDEICPLKRAYEFYAQLSEPKELVVIDGADHLFDGKVPEVAEAIVDLLADYETPTN